MNDEISHAFAHPEARAAAQPAHPGALPDRISLRDHIVSVDIGAFQVERGVKQRLAFNIVVEVAPPKSARTDDVDTILSYDKVTEAIAHELAAERLNLLETLAERIAARILGEPAALRIFVRIEKLDRGSGALGVEIMRQAGMAVGASADAPRPSVVFVPFEAVSSPDLPAALAGLNAGSTPVVLTVGMAQMRRSGDPKCQRHIDLLAIEQTAWRVAGLDPELNVVATRTELDWAIRQGGVCVWAPAKLVLDAVGGPQGPVDALAVAQWFANEWNAVAFSVLNLADLT